MTDPYIDEIAIYPFDFIPSIDGLPAVGVPRKP